MGIKTNRTFSPKYNKGQLHFSGRIVSRITAQEDVIKAMILCTVVGSTPIGLEGVRFSCILSLSCDNADVPVPRRCLGPPCTLVATAVDCADIDVRTRACE